MGTVAAEDRPAVEPLPVAAEPIVWVNGRRRVLPDGKAEVTLLEYLRETGLPGTKLGCGEGGCGACTVMVSHYDFLRKKVIHRSVNACLAPLYSVEGMHVVTVEGIGNHKDGLHPVQERLWKAHGSQCGFCTPGFVMSMYALLRSSTEPPTETEIEENLAGNLCRCTGYRPILDAFRVFAKSDASAHTMDSLAAAGAGSSSDVAKPLADGALFANGGGICPSTGRPCDCGKAGTESEDVAVATQEIAPLWGNTQGNGLNQPRHGGASGKGSPSVNGGGGACDCVGSCKSHSRSKATINGLPKPYPTTSPGEPIFPPELMSRQPGPLLLKGENGSTWHRPTSLDDLLDLKAKFPAAKLVVGNSEIGIELKFKHAGFVYMHT